MGTGYGTGEGDGGGGAAKVTPIGALLIVCLIVHNALEPSKTPLNGP